MSKEVRNFLWVDQGPNSTRAEEILSKKGLSFKSFSVHEFHPTDLADPPPVLITPHGEFAGVELIEAYSNVSPGLLREVRK